MLYVLILTAGILIGYNLCQELTYKDNKKHVDEKKIYKKNEEDVVKEVHVVNKPFVIEDLKDDILPKLHEEVEVAK